MTEQELKESDSEDEDNFYWRIISWFRCFSFDFRSRAMSIQFYGANKLYKNKRVYAIDVFILYVCYAINGIELPFEGAFDVGGVA